MGGGSGVLAAGPAFAGVWGLWASPFRLALVDGFGLIPLHGAAQFRRHDFGDFFQDFLTSFARAAGLEWPLLVLLG